MILLQISCKIWSLWKNSGCMQCQNFCSYNYKKFLKTSWYIVPTQFYQAKYEYVLGAHVGKLTFKG